MSVSPKLVGLEVADRDGVHELVVVLHVGGSGPAGAGVAEVQVLRVSGPPSVREPECPLFGGSVFLGYYHGSAVLQGRRRTLYHHHMLLLAGAYPRPSVQRTVPHGAPGVGGDGVLVSLVVGVAVISSNHVDLVVHLIRDRTKSEVNQDCLKILTVVIKT